jgi:hypothetical protein
MKPMNRRKFVKTLGLGAGARAAPALLAASRAETVSTGTRPNIICLILDE